MNQIISNSGLLPRTIGGSIRSLSGLPTGRGVSLHCRKMLALELLGWLLKWQYCAWRRAGFRIAAAANDEQSPVGMGHGDGPFPSVETYNVILPFEGSTPTRECYPDCTYLFVGGPALSRLVHYSQHSIFDAFSFPWASAFLLLIWCCRP